MRAAGEMYLRLALPSHYVELSLAHDSLNPASELLGGDAASNARLHSALTSVGIFARSQNALRSWALLLAPRSGAVDAVLLLRTLERPSDGALEQYYDSVTTNQDDPKIVNRTIARTMVADLEALVVSDFVLPRAAEGPARERGFVIVDTGVALLEFDIETQDMSLFDNAGQYLLGLVATGWGGFDEK